jgi:hypothetical protein
MPGAANEIVRDGELGKVATSAPGFLVSWSRRILAVARSNIRCPAAPGFLIVVMEGRGSSGLVDGDVSMMKE